MPGRILIADDRFASRLMLSALFGGAFYDIVQADRAEDVVDLAATESPGAVVLSDAMAGPGTVQLCQMLRQSQQAGQVLRIVMTDRHDPSRCATLIGAGADDVISRSCSDEEILARVQRLFHHKARMTELSMQDVAGLRSAGLAEPGGAFARPPRVMIVSDALQAQGWASQIAATLGLSGGVAPVLRAPAALSPSGDAPIAADVVILDAVSLGRDMTLRLTAQIHRGQAPDAPQILLATPESPSLSVKALEYGAAAILPVPFDAAEACARIDLLYRRQSEITQLRDRIKKSVQSALLDPLTGLFNRRYALPRIEQLITDVHDGGRPAALLMGDLDHFKWINDTFGHQAGDAVLQSVAAQISEDLAGHGFAARIGGEEFLIALPACGRDAAAAFARRLRRGVADRTTEYPAAPGGLRVTMSIGVATIEAGAPRAVTPAKDEAARWLSRADRALYRAKAAGRDCVVSDQRIARFRSAKDPLRMIAGRQA